MGKDIVTEAIVHVIKADGKGAIYNYTESRYKKFEANILASGFRLATIAEIQKRHPGHEIVEADTKDDKEVISSPKIKQNGKVTEVTEDKKVLDKEAFQKEDKEAFAESTDVK